MKSILFLILCIAGQAFAQVKPREILLPENGDLHLLSPEPIQYVDISTKNIEGNIALPNLLRLRYKDSIHTAAAVTIAGEKYIVQYTLLPYAGAGARIVEISPADTRPLDVNGSGLSHPQLNNLAWRIFCHKPKQQRKVSAFGIQAQLNQVYTAGDYLFLDISYSNKTNLRYDIDNFRFKIDDKKISKTTNVQTVEIKPENTLFDIPAFRKTYRNIFALKKMSFPGHKVLHIELSEKQLSGRVITLTVRYQDILDADTVPN